MISSSTTVIYRDIEGFYSDACTTYKWKTYKKITQQLNFFIEYSAIIFMKYIFKPYIHVKNTPKRLSNNICELVARGEFSSPRENQSSFETGCEICTVTEAS